MLEDFRQSNDLLAATQAAAQWKEHSIQERPHSILMSLAVFFLS